MLYDGTGGKVNLFDQSIIKNMGEYIVRSYVGNGWVVNFADASAKGGDEAPLIFRYGNAVGSNIMKQHAVHLNSISGKSPMSATRDIFRTFQQLLHQDAMSRAMPLYQAPDYTWYPETQFCYMANNKGFFLGAKGGFNDESHNHNDVGTFSFYLNATPVIIDAGVGTYTRQTFGRERYTIWTMQSDYHNLPMINGTAQRYGANYKATDVSFNSKRKTFSANITTAYPAEAKVKKWQRSYQLNKESVKIEDSFTLTEAVKPNQINFLTWGKVSIDTPGEVIIEVNNEKIQLLYDRNIFTSSLETIHLNDTRLSNVWGKEIYRLSLHAVKKELSGTYTYTINSLNK
jgi:hypothetical protein